MSELAESAQIDAEAERKKWLEQRRRYICSSDAAAIMGVQAFANSRSALNVYLEKTTDEIFPEPDSEEITWGNILEPVVAAEYARREGVVVQQPSPKLTVSGQFPWAAASIDFMVSDGRILEIKTTGLRLAYLWGSADTDHIPDFVNLQVHHQMLVSGVTVADVAVLIGGSDYRKFTIVRNEDLIGLMIEREQAFLRAVEERQPPEPQWGWDSENTLKALQKIHRPIAGEKIKLGKEFLQIAADLERAREIKAAAEIKERECKSKLVFSMGPAELAEFEGADWTVHRKIVTKNWKQQEARQTTEEHIKVLIPGEKKKKRGSEGLPGPSQAAIEG